MEQQRLLPRFCRVNDSIEYYSIFHKHMRQTWCKPLRRSVAYDVHLLLRRIENDMIWIMGHAFEEMLYWYYIHPDVYRRNQMIAIIRIIHRYMYKTPKTCFEIWLWPSCGRMKVNTTRTYTSHSNSYSSMTYNYTSFLIQHVRYCNLGPFLETRACSMYWRGPQAV